MTDSMVAALRPVPRLHGLRHRLPVGRAVRPADRGHPGRRSSGATARPARDRALRALIFALFPYPRRLRLLRGPLRAYQRSGLGTAGPARRAAGPAARRGWPPWSALRPAARHAPSRLPERTPRAGDAPAAVGLLTGCVQGVFFPGVNAATARVLAAEGCDVVVPPRPGLLRRAVGARRPRGGGAGVRPARPSTPSRPPASTTSWSTRPAAARR